MTPSPIAVSEPTGAPAHPDFGPDYGSAGDSSFASAAAEVVGTVSDVKRKGLAAKAAQAVAVERIRGVVPDADDGLSAGRGGDVVVLDTPLARAADVTAHLGVRGSKRLTAFNPRRPIGDLLPTVSAAPQLTYRPTTRALDGSNRLSVRLDSPAGKVGLAEALGWASGPLAVSVDGEWRVLTPDRIGRPLERNDGRCSLTTDGRLRLSLAVADGLEAHPGDELMVLVLPEHGAVALCPTVAVLTGAPLSLLTETNHNCCERNHHHAY